MRGKCFRDNGIERDGVQRSGVASWGSKPEKGLCCASLHCEVRLNPAGVNRLLPRSYSWLAAGSEADPGVKLPIKVPHATFPSL